MTIFDIKLFFLFQKKISLRETFGPAMPVAFPFSASRLWKGGFKRLLTLALARETPKDISLVGVLKATNGDRVDLSVVAQGGFVVVVVQVQSVGAVVSVLASRPEVSIDAGIVEITAGVPEATGER